MFEVRLLKKQITALENKMKAFKSIDVNDVRHIHAYWALHGTLEKLQVKLFFLTASESEV